MSEANKTVMLRHESGRNKVIPHTKQAWRHTDGKIHVEFKMPKVDDGVEFYTETYGALEWEIEGFRPTESAIED